MSFKIEKVESDKSKKIGEMIKSYNRSKRELSESVPLNIYYEDEYGTLKAGLVAEAFGNWLEIEYLFVNEDLRWQGIGSKIIKMAEEVVLLSRK